MDQQDAPRPATDTGTPEPRRRTNVRWLIAVMLGVGLIIAFIDRANLSVAMPEIKEEYGFGATMQGVLLGAWVWTYALFQLPAGWLGDRVGARLVYARAITVWSLATAATALVRGVGGLLGLRLLLGVGEAPIMPVSAKAVSEWFPRQERALASGLYGAGSEAGAAVAVPFVALLMVYTGWRGSFVVAGALGLVVAVLWLWIYRRPREHPWASPAEVAHIESGGAHADAEGESGTTDRTLPWARLFRYRTVWGLFFGYICRNFLNYFFITWYPTFLMEAKGFSTMDLAKYGAIPALVAIGANFAGGGFSDWLVRRGLSLGVARKTPILIGTLSAGTVGLAVLTDSQVMAVVFLTIGFAGSSFASAAILSLPIDVAPGAGNVSSIYGVQNLGSQIGGLASPLVIGFLLDTTGTFVVPLVLMGALCLVAAAIYAFVVRVEPLRVPPEPDSAPTGSPTTERP